MGKMKYTQITAEAIRAAYNLDDTSEAEVAVVLMTDYTDTKQELIKELAIWQEAGLMYISHYTGPTEHIDYADNGFVLCTHSIAFSQENIGYLASKSPASLVNLYGHSMVVYHGEVG